MRFGEEYVIMPYTYVLPGELDELKAYLDADDNNHVIVKPVGFIFYHCTHFLASKCSWRWYSGYKKDEGHSDSEHCHSSTVGSVLYNV